MHNINTFKNLLYSNIDDSWLDFFKQEQSQPYYDKLIDTLYETYTKEEVYPSIENIFRVFKDMSYDSLKVIIIGQDPYHTPGVADGLAFSSKIKLAPSLRNIFKEIESDCGIVNTNSDLSYWSKQGVMLLNSALSVVSGQPNSHQKLGWATFIKHLILYLNQKKHLVYILWGNHAKDYAKYISNQYIIDGYHPSPFSASKYYGGKYFSRCNDYLKKHQINQIDWRTL